MAVDTLTGEYRIERVDILHDVGTSLNPEIDIGQIEGGFVQGAGWLTTEELVWDAQGRLRTHAPSTYKIPACGDRPRVFNVRLLEGADNREDTIFRSKAVGEPPLMLGISVLHALSDAVASVADYRLCPRLDAPGDARAGAGHDRAACSARRHSMASGLAPRLRAMAGGRNAGGARGRSRGRSARHRAKPGPRCWSRPRRRCGTIGGGRLEMRRRRGSPHDARAAAKRSRRWTCRSARPSASAAAAASGCGSNARTRAVLEEIEAAEQAERGRCVLLFGAGHVGRALARALAPLPFRLRWIDGRPEEFDATLAADGRRDRRLERLGAARSPRRLAGSRLHRR